MFGETNSKNLHINHVSFEPYDSTALVETPVDPYKNDQQSVPFKDKNQLHSNILSHISHVKYMSTISGCSYL